MARIVHVDINSYFATILQQENPSLRGKPIGVVKSSGRTCVIAASKEAKKLGVTTGCRVKDARLRAPNIQFIPATFDTYLSCTHRLNTLFRSLTPEVDIFSLDEAFLDLTTDTYRHSNLHAFGTLVQRKIKESLGEWVTCNVGISHNKLLAKLAGEVAPKGSIFEIHEKNMDSVLATASLRDVCGIGFRLEEKLNRLGVYHPYQIHFLGKEVLRTHFGPFWSIELTKIACGQETHFFTKPKKVEHMQSVGRTITGYTLTSDPVHIKQTLLNLLEEATRKLREMDLAGNTIGVSLRGSDTSWGKYKRLSYFVRHTNEIYRVLSGELQEVLRHPFPVIRFGVWIGGLQPMDTIPQCFLPEWQKQEKLYHMIDAVNQRFGLFTLKPASLTGFRMIKPEVTGFLGDKHYHGLG